MGKYIVMDVVFYGSSLNYDQGAGNYQELKKITKWDGKQYVLVSRYALRYSLLHTANKINNNWKLADSRILTEDGGVASPNIDENNVREVLNYPEFDLFGFMCAKEGQGSTFTRTSPVKISHAISMTPYNFDSHFSANLDMMRRASGPGAGSNPVNIEEKKDFYIYNITIDGDRVGKYTQEEHGIENVGDIKIDDNEKKKRILTLIDAVFNLKREIKGRMEDLSPWLVVCGLYNDIKYETYVDKIELAKSHKYKVITKEVSKKEGDKTITEIEHETIERNAPKFVIDTTGEFKQIDTYSYLKQEIQNFLQDKTSANNNTNNNTNNMGTKPLVYKRKFIDLEKVQ
ncbi:MAG: type I-B CRISPR-associated protein Cas7/Cst2/DevR [Nitrososphaeria archaeon]